MVIQTPEVGTFTYTAANIRRRIAPNEDINMRPKLESRHITSMSGTGRRSKESIYLANGMSA